MLCIFFWSDCFLLLLFPYVLIFDIVHVLHNQLLYRRCQQIFVITFIHIIQAHISYKPVLKSLSSISYPRLDGWGKKLFPYVPFIQDLVISSPTYIILERTIFRPIVIFATTNHHRRFFFYLQEM